MDSAHEIEALLEHREWLRALARSLVRDRDLADELAQETWLSALRAKALPGFARGWLAAVLRNHHQQAARASRHRVEREQRASVPEQLPSVADSLAALSLQETLARELHALEEPLRTTLVLKYVEGLSRREIAKRTGVAIATVGGRLERGLRTLRERLDRLDSAGPESWLSACLILGWPKPTSALTTSSLLLATMGTTTKIALASSVFVALLGAMVWSSLREPPSLPEFAAVASRTAEPDPPAPRTIVATSGEARAPVEARPAEPPTAAPVESTAPPLRELVGLALDTDARPLARVGLRFVASAGSGSETRRTDAAGEARFELASGSGWLELDDEEWMTVGSCQLPLAIRNEENVVLAGRKHPIEGVVVDERGVPVAGATVRLVLPEGFRARFPRFLDRTMVRTPSAETDAGGRFRLPAAFVSGASVVAERSGFTPTERPLESLAQLAAQIVLRREGTHSPSLTGRVVDPLGWPVAGASVSFGAEVVETDELGQFELPREGRLTGYDRMVDRVGGESCLLQAVAPGFLPARLQVERAADGTPRWPDGLTLSLGEGELAFAGKVVDELGDPVAGALVWLDGLQLFSMRAGGEPVEAGLGGRPGERQLTWETDARGEFELRGLLDRDYVIGVLDQQNQVLVHTPPLNPATSSEVEIEADSGAVWPIVAGRVLSREGTGISNTLVHLFFDANRVLSDEQFIRSSSMLMKSARTDATGRFELERVPREHAYLGVYGDDIEFTRHDFEPGLTERAVRELELVAVHRVHVRVELPAGLAATEIAFLDGDGRELMLSIHQGKPGTPSPRMPFEGEFTDVLSVAETAETLVYWNGEQELERKRVALQRGVRNEL